jgi:hemerythrin-like domain-containing protein
MHKKFLSTIILLIIFFSPSVCLQEFQIPLTEDLMREHGLLNRILLIYEKIIRKIEHNNILPHEALTESAQIIKSFLEEYHEKLEEDYVFPLFEKAGKETELIKTLRKQHRRGRQITVELQKLTKTKDIKNSHINQRIKSLLQEFISMYRPHEAREDTVLFPQVRLLISEKQFNQLSRTFDQIEERILGENGFEKMVAKVTTIEKSLDIYDLSQFGR